MATITYAGASFTFPNLTAHPLSFDTTDASRGKAAEVLTFTGILKGTEANTLKGIWQAWRDARLPQEPPERSGVVGATVAVTATGPGFAWSNRAAWFTDAPAFEAISSARTRVTAAFIDANQSLAVRLRDLEEAEEEQEALSLGTITLGTAVINLTEQPDALEPPPAPELSPAGAHILTGPLVAIERREIRGWVTAANRTNLVSWFATTVAATPAAGAWFPVSRLKPEARLQRNAGVVSIVYDVAFEVIKIRGAA